MTVYGNSGEAWFWLLIGLAIEWLVIWSAVRVATDRVPASGRTTLVARTEQRPEGLSLSIRNRGHVAALYLTVRWQGPSEAEPLLTALLLAPDEEVSAFIAAPAEPGDLKAGVIVVRYMIIKGLYRNEHVERFAVLAPPTVPDLAIIAPPAPTAS